MFSSIQIYIIILLAGIGIGSGIFWEVGTWRVNTEKLAEANDQKAISEATTTALQAQLADWVKKANDSIALQNSIAEKQQQINADADEKAIGLTKQIANITDAAKNLVPTNCVLDPAHQRLLATISSTANNSATRNTKSSSSTNPTPKNTAVPKLGNQ